MIASSWIGRRRWLGMLVLGLGTLASASGAAERFERTLPGDCVLFVNLNDGARTKERFEQLRLVRLFQDPLMKPFVDGVMAEVRKLEAVVPGVALGGQGLPDGQVSLAAAIQQGAGPPIPIVYLLVDLGKREAQSRQMIDQLAALLEGQGFTKRTVGELTVFAQGAPQPGWQVCLAIKEGTLVLGNDPDSLGLVVAALREGRRGSLAESTRFQRFRERTGGPSDFELFIDLVPVLRERADLPPQLVEAIGELGLDRFQSLGLSCMLGVDGLEMKTQLVVDIDGTPAILDLLSMPADAHRPEPWIPPTVVAYFSCQWDLGKFYDKLMEILARKDPRLPLMIDGIAAGEDPNQPLVRIKEDLIGPLGNRVTVASDLAQIEGRHVPRTLLAWELDEGPAFQAFLGRVMDRGLGLWLETKKVGNRTVYMYNAGALQQGRPPGQMPLGVVAFTMTDTHFLLATHVELLDQVLGFQGAGLAENPAYQQVAQRFPARTSAISFVRDDEQARLSWDRVKSGDLSRILDQVVKDEGKQLLAGLIRALDGSNLPAYEEVKKYFHLSAGHVVMDERGIHLVWMSPQ